MFWSDRLCARRSCARLLCDSALSGMAGIASTLSVLACWRLPEETERRGALPVGAKYPERWFGAGDVGDESTDDASVSVSRETWEEDRERAVVALLSESSAE